MKKYLISTAVSALVASGAAAGGLDRSNQSALAVFNDPGEVTFSFGVVMPNITGVDNTGTATAGQTYDVSESYTAIAGSVTGELGEVGTWTIIFDQPFGADILYDTDSSTSQLGGTFADLGSNAITALGRYEVNDQFSVFGGLRFQQAGGDVGLGGLAYAAGFASASGAESLATALGAAAAGGSVPAQTLLGLDDVGTVLQGVALGLDSAADATALATAALGAGTVGAIQAGTLSGIGTLTAASAGGELYRAEIEDSWGTGFVLGAAYEIPDIALRLAVTYNSRISHSGDTVESGPAVAGTGVTEFDTPQSINLDFQTGIAADTLLTASVRWAEWGSFDVIPPNLGSDLANIDDSIRYTLGVARRFNEQLAGSISLSYEEDGGSATVSPLGPNDGVLGLTVGMRYENEGTTISGGINYTKLGDAFAGVGGQPVALFEGNSAVGIGFQIATEF